MFASTVLRASLLATVANNPPAPVWSPVLATTATSLASVVVVIELAPAAAGVSIYDFVITVPELLKINTVRLLTLPLLVAKASLAGNPATLLFACSPLPANLMITFASGALPSLPPGTSFVVL